MQMGIKVGVVGGSGYAGAELLRLLLAHPGFDIRTVAGGGSAGRSLREVYPSLDLDVIIAPSQPEALEGCEVVFLATPHEASLELAPALLDAGAAVVDLSAAFRLPPDVFTAWYGLAHTAPQLAPAAYGLPELFRDGLAQARLIANPGCYPTAALLALAPLAGLVDPASVVVTGMSGASGAGKGLRDDLHVSHALHNVMAYAAPRHRHTPEIAAGWSAVTGVPAAVTFTPHLVPMTRGLVCTVVAQATAATDAATLAEAYATAYDGEPFVRLVGAGGWPQTAHVRGANAATVAAAFDPDTGRITASCAIDNLVKGAAGQALQNANLVAGFDEATGLATAGMYP